MTEADAAASSLPALVLLSCWWALLSTLDIFFGPNWPGDAARTHRGHAGKRRRPPSLIRVLRRFAGSIRASA